MTSPRYVVRRGESGYVVLDIQKQNTFAFATRDSARKAAKKKERDYGLRDKKKVFKSDTHKPDVDLAEEDVTLFTVLDSIDQELAVAEVWRKLLKRAPLSKETKEKINDALVGLIKKWRAVQCNLTNGE
jgi:hypothetical protein